MTASPPRPSHASPQRRCSRRRSRSRRRRSTCRPSGGDLPPAPPPAPSAPPAQASRRSRPVGLPSLRHRRRDRPRRRRLRRRRRPPAPRSCPTTSPATARGCRRGAAGGDRGRDAREGRASTATSSPVANLRFEGETGRRKWGFSLTAEQAARAGDPRPSPSTARSTCRPRIRSSHHASTTARSSTSRSPPARTRPISTPRSRRARSGRASTSSPSRSTSAIAPTARSSRPTTSGPSSRRTAPASSSRATTRPASPASTIFPPSASDATGRTRIHLIAPGGERAFAESDLARLVQAIVLRGNFRQAVVSVDDGNATRARRRACSALPSAPRRSSRRSSPAFRPKPARRRPSASSTRPGVAPTLVVSGPALAGRQGGDRLRRRRRRPAARRRARSTIDTHADGPAAGAAARRRTAPDASPNSACRRRSSPGGGFRTRVLSSACRATSTPTPMARRRSTSTRAYTGEVRPGSHIDVYVNGFIAANLPLTSGRRRHPPAPADQGGDDPLPARRERHRRRGGARHRGRRDLRAGHDRRRPRPLRPVRHERVLHARPSAGSSAGRTSSALAGAGLPYARSEAPVPIVLGRADGETYGAALTFLSRVAVSAARVIPVEMGRPDALGTQPAIFVGALGQFSAPTVAEFGVADAARTAWDEPSAIPTRSSPSTSIRAASSPTPSANSSSTRRRLRPLAERTGQSERHPRALARVRALARAELRSLVRLARHLRRARRALRSVRPGDARGPVAEERSTGNGPWSPDATSRISSPASRRSPRPFLGRAQRPGRRL